MKGQREKRHSKKMIDLHCHIFPGLDDGSQTMEESLEMARIAEKDGIEKMVGTPHLFRDNFFYKDLGIIESKRREFIKVLEKNNIRTEVFGGTEVHISHNLIHEIRKNKEALVLNQSSYMFVEFPAEHVFSGIKNLFYELMSEGIIPIITHPERNSVFIRNPALLFDLIQMGGLSQVNSGSFSGIYGEKARDTVGDFIELGLVHFIASDCHNTHSIAPRLSEAVSKAANIVGKEKAYSFVWDNPQAVLDDKQIPYLPCPVNPREKERSFKIKIPRIFKRRK
ncbi:MAG: tyrosine-protein phosphatase [Acidobacteriota bacterium]